MARETPLLTSNTFARLTGRDVALKAETLQLTGAFKIRGALNTVAQLGAAERRGGVVTASAGNHGQALAWAARHFGIPATIFVPESAPMAKVEAARGYGAACELAGEGFDEAHVAARAYEHEHGATFVHAFEDPRVIAGQGTLGLELAEQLAPGPATVVIPVGGGGLASGIAIALGRCGPRSPSSASRRPPARPSQDGRRPARRSPTGSPSSIPGELTSAILRELLDEIVVVDDEAISEAIVLLLERSKLVVEGAGAAPVAALLRGLVPGDGPACAVLAGGNIDATTLMSVTRFGLTTSGRYLVVAILIPDRPGQLTEIVGMIARQRANMLAVQHYREGRNIGVLETEAELTLETRNEEHSQAVIQALNDARFVVHRLR